MKAIEHRAAVCLTGALHLSVFRRRVFHVAGLSSAGVLLLQAPAAAQAVAIAPTAIEGQNISAAAQFLKDTGHVAEANQILAKLKAGELFYDPKQKENGDTSATGKVTLAQVLVQGPNSKIAFNANTAFGKVVPLARTLYHELVHVGQSSGAKIWGNLPGETTHETEAWTKTIAAEQNWASQMWLDFTQKGSANPLETFRRIRTIYDDLNAYLADFKDNKYYGLPNPAPYQKLANDTKAWSAYFSKLINQIETAQANATPSGTGQAGQPTPQPNTPTGPPTGGSGSPSSPSGGAVPAPSGPGGAGQGGPGTPSGGGTTAPGAPKTDQPPGPASPKGTDRPAGGSGPSGTPSPQPQQPASGGTGSSPKSGGAAAPAGQTLVQRRRLPNEKEEPPPLVTWPSGGTASSSSGGAASTGGTTAAGSGATSPGSGKTTSNPPGTGTGRGGLAPDILDLSKPQPEPKPAQATTKPPGPAGPEPAGSGRISSGGKWVAPGDALLTESVEKKAALEARGIPQAWTAEELARLRQLGQNPSWTDDYIFKAGDPGGQAVVKVPIGTASDAENVRQAVGRIDQLQMIDARAPFGRSGPVVLLDVPDLKLDPSVVEEAKELNEIAARAKDGRLRVLDLLFLEGKLAADPHYFEHLSARPAGGDPATIVQLLDRDAARDLKAQFRGAWHRQMGDWRMRNEQIAYFQENFNAARRREASPTEPTAAPPSEAALRVVSRPGYDRYREAEAKKIEGNTDERGTPYGDAIKQAAVYVRDVQIERIKDAQARAHATRDLDPATKSELIAATQQAADQAYRLWGKKAGIEFRQALWQLPERYLADAEADLKEWDDYVTGKFRDRQLPPPSADPQNSKILDLLTFDINRKLKAYKLAWDRLEDERARAEDELTGVLDASPVLGVRMKDDNRVFLERFGRGMRPEDAVRVFDAGQDALVDNGDRQIDRLKGEKRFDRLFDLGGAKYQAAIDDAMSVGGTPRLLADALQGTHDGYTAQKRADEAAVDGVLDIGSAIPVVGTPVAVIKVVRKADKLGRAIGAEKDAYEIAAFTTYRNLFDAQRETQAAYKEFAVDTILLPAQALGDVATLGQLNTLLKEGQLFSRLKKAGAVVTRGDLPGKALTLERAGLTAERGASEAAAEGGAVKAGVAGRGAGDLGAGSRAEGAAAKTEGLAKTEAEPVAAASGGTKSQTDAARAAGTGADRGSAGRAGSGGTSAAVSSPTTRPPQPGGSEAVVPESSSPLASGDRGNRAARGPPSGEGTPSPKAAPAPADQTAVATLDRPVVKTPDTTAAATTTGHTAAPSEATTSTNAVGDTPRPATLNAGGNARGALGTTSAPTQTTALESPTAATQTVHSGGGGGQSPPRATAAPGGGSPGNPVTRTSSSDAGPTHTISTGATPDALAGTRTIQTPPRRTWGVDPLLREADQRAGVLVDGKYVRNPTARKLEPAVLTEQGTLSEKNWKNAKLMYVVDASGEIIIGARAGTRMPHPTLIGGADPRVVAAGMVEFRSGRIYKVDRLSGHFKPRPEAIDATRDAFERFRLEVSKKFGRDVFHSGFHYDWSLPPQ